MTSQPNPRGGARAGAGRKSRDKRVNIGVQVYESVALEIDESRGLIPRSKWLKFAIKEKLEREKK